MDNRDSYTPEQVADIIILHGAFVFNLKRERELSDEGAVKGATLRYSRFYQRLIPPNVSAFLSLETRLEGI